MVFHWSSAVRTVMACEAIRCSICHQQANLDPARVPGHPEWHLAPREMAWEDKTLAEICAQIKDPARNGGRSLEELVHHIGTDTLVGWAWAPGFGRQPAPGTQKQAGALVEAWVRAHCPYWRSGNGVTPEAWWRARRRGHRRLWCDHGGVASGARA
jgi:hypothetical protein